jgi:hypothetical protein
MRKSCAICGKVVSFPTPLADGNFICATCGVKVGEINELRHLTLEQVMRRVEERGVTLDVSIETEKPRTSGMKMASKFIVCTGDLNLPYEILDTIFAMESHTAKGWGSHIKPERAFSGVKTELERECRRLGGNAVINCQFEYRNSLDPKLLGGSNQVIEIFAYGTAVSYDEL